MELPFLIDLLVCVVKEKVHELAESTIVLYTTENSGIFLDVILFTKGITQVYLVHGK